jgi:cardiolipin synthase
VDRVQSNMQETAICQCEGDTVQVFVEGDTLYDAMRADIVAARLSTDLEAYILAGDAVGRAFVTALCERARDGVRVRVELDAFGSLPLANSALTRELRDAGAGLRWHHGWSWRRPWRIDAVKVHC